MWRCFLFIIGFSAFLFIPSVYADWQIDTVDSGNVGSFTSLVLDSLGNPWIAYYNAANADLKLATYDGERWQRITVDEEGDVGQYCDLVLDSEDMPRIVYCDMVGQNNQRLKYAAYDGTEWQIETIDLSGVVGTWCTIALDTDGNPHLAYVKNDLLTYAVYDGSEWTMSTLSEDGDVVWFSSIALDANDTPHIMFQDHTNADLIYGNNGRDSWAFTTLDSDDEVGMWPSLAIDSGTFPHVAYFDQTNIDLKYAYRKSVTEWETETVDSEGNVGSYASLALDNSDKPFVSYYDAGNSDLKLATLEDDVWQLSVVDSEGSVGKYSSIAIDSQGYPNIAYYDETNQSLKIARYYYEDHTGVNLAGFSAIAMPNAAIKVMWNVTSDGEPLSGLNLYRRAITNDTQAITPAQMTERSTGLGRWVRVNSRLLTSLPTGTYIDRTVQAGTSYTYMLQAVLADGHSKPLGTTDGRSTLLPGSFAITVVYPQPTTTVLTCRLNIAQPGDVELKLYDLAGRTVKSQRLQAIPGEMETALDVSGLAGGVYVLQAGSKGEKSTKRVVIAR